MELKLWKYYIRKATNAMPEMKVRCVGVHPNCYIIQFPNKHVVMVNKNHEPSLILYSNLPKPKVLENK